MSRRTVPQRPSAIGSLTGRAERRERESKAEFCPSTSRGGSSCVCAGPRFGASDYHCLEAGGWWSLAARPWRASGDGATASNGCTSMSFVACYCIHLLGLYRLKRQRQRRLLLLLLLCSSQGRSADWLRERYNNFARYYALASSPASACCRCSVDASYTATALAAAAAIHRFAFTQEAREANINHHHPKAQRVSRGESESKGDSHAY